MQKLTEMTLPTLFAALLLAVAAGCADWGFNRESTRKAEAAALAKYGPTANQRIDELKQIAKEAKNYGSNQEQIAQDLAKRMQNETNPLVRAQILRTLQQLPTQTSRAVAAAAANDPDRYVRVACCQIWGEWGGPQGVEILGNSIANDADMDVRLAAARALGKISDASAVQAMAPALEDPDPALQFLAVQSLQEMTGQDLGNDVNAWRQFVQNPAAGTQRTESIAERFRRLY